MGTVHIPLILNCSHIQFLARLLSSRHIICDILSGLNINDSACGALHKFLLTSKRVRYTQIHAKTLLVNLNRKHSGAFLTLLPKEPFPSLRISRRRSMQYTGPLRSVSLCPALSRSRPHCQPHHKPSSRYPQASLTALALLCADASHHRDVVNYQDTGLANARTLRYSQTA